MNLILENRTQEKNPFLEKSFLSVRKSIAESHLSEDIKKEFSSFLAFDAITEKNFKRIFEIMIETWWDKKFFVYDEDYLKEDFYKSAIKIFLKVWEDIFRETWMELN